MAGSVPILMYHSLDDSDSVISVRPTDFRRHIQLLRDRGFVGISLIDLLDGWDGRQALPEKPVVLTFDDAFASLLDHAVPALREVGFSATIFAVAGYCGKSNDWPSQPPGVPRMSLMTMAQLRSIADAGIEIGAHTMTHPRLDGISEADVRREIIESQAALQQELGRSVRTFAYPYGAWSNAAKQVAGECFAGSCSVEMGMARKSVDRQLLPRLDAYYLRDPSIFRHFGTPLGSAYLSLRKLGRTCRGMLHRSNRESSGY